MRIIRVLVLEDDLKTLSKVFEKLSRLEDKYFEERLEVDFSTVVLSEYTQVEEFINNNDKVHFDIVLLDRDCKVGGSFHVLNLDKFHLDNIISISSIPTYNEEVRLKGISKIIHKDYEDLDNFASKVVKEIESIVLGLAS